MCFCLEEESSSRNFRAVAAAEDFSPSVLPPAEIDDPTDIKPATWVDAKEIPDPTATRPEDWDEDAPSTIEDPQAVKPEGWLDAEPPFINDPAAKKPAEWDDEEDGAAVGVVPRVHAQSKLLRPPPPSTGEWEPPSVENPKCESAPGCGVWHRPVISNPAYKGPWHPPRIPNPEYKGEWAPRKVLNPAYFEDAHPGRLGGAAMGSLGVEVWTMSGGITYNSFLVTRSEAAAEAFGTKTWQPKHAAQEAAAAADALAKEHEARLSAAEKGGWAEKAAYWVGEATALAKSQPAATAVAAVVLASAFIALAFFFCTGGPGGGASAPHGPAIYEPEDERAASAAARRDARQEAAAAKRAAAGAPAAAAASATDAAPDDSQENEVDEQLPSKDGLRQRSRPEK